MPIDQPSGVGAKFSYLLFGLPIECFDVAWPGKHDLCHHPQFESNKNNKKKFYNFFFCVDIKGLGSRLYDGLKI